MNTLDISDLPPECNDQGEDNSWIEQLFNPRDGQEGGKGYYFKTFDSVCRFLGTQRARDLLIGDKRLRITIHFEMQDSPVELYEDGTGRTKKVIESALKQKEPQLIDVIIESEEKPTLPDPTPPPTVEKPEPIVYQVIRKGGNDRRRRYRE